MPVTGRSTHDGRESWRQRMAATPQPNNNPTKTQANNSKERYVCMSIRNATSRRATLHGSCHTANPTCRAWRRGRTVLCEQHHGPHHPLLSGLIVDRVITQGHVDELTRLCVMMLVLTVVRVGSRYGCQMWMERFGQNSIYRLVSDEFENSTNLTSPTSTTLALATS